MRFKVGLGIRDALSPISESHVIQIQVWYLNLEALPPNNLIFWVELFIEFKFITLGFSLRNQHTERVT